MPENSQARSRHLAAKQSILLIGSAHQEAPHDWYDCNTTLLDEGSGIVDDLNLR
jgi:hypothetical protein